MKIRFSLFILFTFVFCQLFAQNSVFKIKKELNWAAAPTIYNPLGTSEKKLWVFDGSAQHPENPVLPVINFRFPVTGKGTLTPIITGAIYEPFDQLTAEEADQIIAEDITLNTAIVKNRNAYFGKVQLLPIRKTADGRFERLTSFGLNVSYQNATTFTPPPPPNTFDSVLRDGLIYKIAVAEDGVYKLDYNFLKDDLKIDIDNINPRQIRLFGNGGGFLPELIETFREDDLVENHIQIVDGGDNSFDSGDYILFYGEGPHKWYFDETRERFDRPQNPYDTRNYYFLKINSGNAQTISDQNSTNAPAYTVTTFNDFDRFEEDKINLLGALARGGHGTGKTWYGDQFNPTRERNYNFEFPNIVSSSEVDVTVTMALRSASSSHFNVIAGGETFRSTNASGVNLNEAETTFARSKTINGKFSGAQSNLTIQVTNPPDGTQINEAFLDYVQVNVRRNLIMTGNQMDFRDINVRDYPNATYEVGGINDNHQIWDITDPLRPRIQKGERSGNSFRFGVDIIPGNPIKTFIGFNQQEGLLSAEAIGPVSNQNIHAIRRADMVIVYHPEFEAATQRLADHRRQFSNLEVVTVPIEHVYNEFSSGKQDPTAIRDFVRMLYDRDEDFKYLLLFGDGSYDYRNITNTPNLDNYIPVYQTDEHLSPISGFPADDYFGLVSEEDGNILSGELDIAVGRIPARDAFTADKVIDKIIFYDTDPERFRDWRNQLLFVGDDGDGNLHTNQANLIADTTTQRHDYFNVDKILFDAFQRVTTSGGIRFPQANQSINRNAFRGSLVTNYLGHGGPTGWAQERVLQVEDIESWQNFERLPLVITATCSFGGYDDHTDFPGAEVAVMKPDGGAIALFTTVRAVFSSSNFILTKGVFDNIFNNKENGGLAFGEILRNSKNGNGASPSNNRKFTLLGDPAQRLAIPQFNVGTTSINGRPVDVSATPDTISALEKVTITGYVFDNDGNVMSDFNGRVYPTIYDKISRLQTFGQGGNEVKDFELRKNILFKGVATVTNGLFSFEFIVPKDIDYNFGFGKISYYAEDGTRDANGSYNRVVIGGTSANPIVDDQGPVVEVFMNTEDFVTGGTTDKDPVLLVNLSDDNGINIGGISIGHDLTAVLDDQTQNTYVLNDFYTAELDDFSKGTVRFPLFDIEEGLHRINVKAWDTSNNSGEGSTEFLVFNSEDAALKHVLNYPNPFTTNTNFQFEHQLSGQDLQILVQIFTVSGKLVKTIEKDTYADGFRVTDVNWDGKDDYGDRLARGVYLYKIKVKGTNAKDEDIRTESGFEKLVILK